LKWLFAVRDEIEAGGAARYVATIPDGLDPVGASYPASWRPSIASSFCVSQSGTVAVIRTVSAS